MKIEKLPYFSSVFYKSDDSIEVLTPTINGLSPVDFDPWINTNFSSLPSSLPNQTPPNGRGFNFSKFERLIQNQSQNQLITDKRDDLPLCPAVWSVDCEDGLIILGM